MVDTSLIIRKLLAVASHLLRSLLFFASQGRRFGADSRGNVAIIVAFASVALVVAVGAGIDLARAYGERQKLSEVSTLTCQYSTRPSVVATNNGGTTGFTAYINAVNTYATSSIAQQGWTGPSPTGTNGTFFTATAPIGSSTIPTSPVTEIQASMPTTFLGIIGVKTVAIHAKVGCQNAATTSTIVTSPLILQEGFETPCATFCYTKPDGTSGYSTTSVSTVPTSPSYTGATGAQWYTLGYCLETDTVGAISSSVPEGTHSAELDCENGSNNAGNSSISSKVSLKSGVYELRYNYRERIPNVLYTPAYVCGSQINPDINWVSNNTNQINVYLDQATSTFPTHTTLDGTQTLGGTNLIDTCVNSLNWIERSIVITVTTTGSYWLSFAADGANDSYGGQIDNIRLCQGLCAGAPQDDFPSSYLSSAALSDLFSASNALSWNLFTKSTSIFISPMCNFILLCAPTSRTASDVVMLDPGFYDLAYQYVSLATFSSPPGSGCNQTPRSADVTPFTSKTVTATNTSTFLSYSTKADVDFLGIFLSFPNQTVTPNIGGTISVTNPLVDSCLYAPAILSRSVAFQVTKPGYYPLSFFAGGTAAATSEGGAIANVTIKAIGSPYTMNTSGYCPAVPVPGPQIGSAIAYTGFSFVVTNPFVRASSSAPSCVPT